MYIAPIRKLWRRVWTGRLRKSRKWARSLKRANLPCPSARFGYSENSKESLKLRPAVQRSVSQSAVTLRRRGGFCFTRRYGSLN